MRGMSRAVIAASRAKCSVARTRAGSLADMNELLCINRVTIHLETLTELLA